MTVVSIRATLYDGSVMTKVLSEQRSYIQELLTLPVSDLEKRIDIFFKHFAIPTSIGLAALTESGKAFAATAVTATNPQAIATAASGKMHLADRLMPLIGMVQEMALPVGIVVSSWGLIEMIMGNIESGKHKLKWSIIGFVGMFLIPQVFYAIRDAFAS